MNKLPAIPTSGSSFDMKDWISVWPSLAALYDTPQDKEHHAEGDVGIHTEMVVRALLEDDEYGNSDPGRRTRLFFAALLHDIGKPLCTREEGGRITSRGHSAVGAIDARVLLWRAGYPLEDREKVCQMIAHHQNPFFAIRQDRPEYWVRKISSLADVSEIACMARADNAGRISVGYRETLDSINLFSMLAEEQGCLDTPYVFPDDHTRVAYFRSHGELWADSPVFKKNGSEVIMLSGLPASGKDTWVAKNAGALPVLSFDDAREELGLKHGDKDAGRAVHLVVDRAKELLRRGEPFVWNATNISPLIRGKALDLLHAYSAQVSCVYLEAPESVIHARNSARDNTLTNKGIDRMLLRWDLPTLLEVHQMKCEVQFAEKINFISNTIAL